MKVSIRLVLVAAGLLAAAGCAKPYKITQELQEPINTIAVCRMAEIQDELPIDFEADKKPSAEQMQKLEEAIMNGLAERDLFGELGNAVATPEYEISGGVLEFRRGSGVVRAIGLFGLGNAYITVHLELKDLRNGNEVVFAGNFKQSVTSYLESGDEMFNRVGHDFAEALEKQIKDLSR